MVCQLAGTVGESELPTSNVQHRTEGKKKWKIERGKWKISSRMFEVQHINSFDLPELAVYRTMKFQGEHRAQGIFVAESEKTVRRLLESELDVVSLVLPGALLAEFEKALDGRDGNIRVYCAPKNVLEELIGF